MRIMIAFLGWVGRTKIKKKKKLRKEGTKRIYIDLPKSSPILATWLLVKT